MAISPYTEREEVFCKVCGEEIMGFPTGVFARRHNYYFDLKYCSEICCIFDDHITYEELIKF